MQFGVLDHLDISSSLSLEEHYRNRMMLIEKLDEGGCFCYHVTEHHGTPLGGAGSPSVFLAAAAQRTTRIRLGTLVYTLPIHHPLRLIEEICMLDVLSDGRLDIGFGRGSVPFELSYFGIDPEDARARYDEALEVVLQGLSTGRIDFRGKYYQFNDLTLFLRPKQKPVPPRWYGVHSVESAERAARLGFNIVCNQPAPASANYIQAFRKTWDRERPNEPLPKIGLARHVHVAEAQAEAIETVQRAYSAFLKSFRYVTRRHGVENRLSGREKDFLELMAVGRGIAGTPTDVGEFLAADLATAGANYCLLSLAFGDLSGAELDRSARLFIDQVMPRLRETSPLRGVA